jgi:hypothetical protein
MVAGSNIQVSSVDCWNDVCSCIAVGAFAIRFSQKVAGVRWIRPVVWFLTTLMTPSELNLIAASFYLGRPAAASGVVAGAVAAVYLAFCLLKPTLKPT